MSNAQSRLLLQRYKRPLIGLAVAIVVYAILGFFLAPWLMPRVAYETPWVSS
jgi:uncharacterized protein YneF (UPF0154 family)